MAAFEIRSITNDEMQRLLAEPHPAAGTVTNSQKEQMPDGSWEFQTNSRVVELLRQKFSITASFVRVVPDGITPVR